MGCHMLWREGDDYPAIYHLQIELYKIISSNYIQIYLIQF